MECTFIKAEKERGMRKMKPQKQLLQLVMLALLSVVSVLVTSNESFAALNCSQCHGNNRTDALLDALPLDTPAGSPAAYRNITTGAVKGNHQTHLSGLNISVTNQFNCARCHNNSNYTSSHRSGTITLNKAINSSPAATNYVGGGMTDNGSFLFKNQTSVPTLGTCSNINCHFETSTPSWGTTAWVAPADCNKCHAASPTSGSHTKHTALGTHAPYTCNNCHAPRPNFQHATSAGNAGRNIDLTGTSMAGTGYTGSNFRYLPSQTGRTFGQCSTNYCHSSGQSFNGQTTTPYTYATPVWNNTAGCGTCHLTSTLNTAAHAKHIVATAGAGECGNCHDNATQATISNTTHVDGLINVNGSQTVAYSQGTSSARGNGYGTCSNTSCHSVFVPASSPAIAWTSTAATCASCHAATPTSGAHNVHLAMPAVTCATCHTAPGAAGHINNNIDVSQGAPGTIAKHASTTYTATCSTVCHSATTSPVTTPTWGAVITGCTACHLSPPTTGDHTKHMASVLTTSCAVCHTGATAGVTGGPGHGNTLIDVAGTLTTTYPTPKAKGSAYATCTTSCHNAYSPTVGIVTPTWGNAATCSSCHVASPTTGDHPKHLASPLTTSCAVCHAGATAGTSGGTAHLDGNIDVTGTLVTGYPVNVVKHASGSGYSTCTTSCHNAYSPATGIATPVWGTTATCSSCHVAVPTTGDHPKHLASPLTTSCGVCHAGAAAGTSGGTAHLDANIDVNGTLVTGYPVNVVKHASGSGYSTCTTSCHNAYSPTTGIATPVWGTAATCNSCHVASPTTGDHTKHLLHITVATGTMACGQ